MSDWVSEAKRLYFEEHQTWGAIIGRLQGYFPGKNADQIRDSIRGVIRRDPRYKGQRQEGPEHKASNGWRNGQYESDRLIEICETEEITPELIMRLHGLKPGLWEVVSYRNNYWHSQTKASKRLVMYQSKLTAKPRAGGLDLDEIDRHFAAMDRKHRTPEIIVPKRDARMMAEINIADLHLGKLCWHGDTGGNYDSKIARDMFYGVIGEIAEQLRRKPLEYITFVWTNDFFNSDTIDKTTTAGTPQDTDVRWQKMFNMGVDMLVAATDILAGIAPVRMFYTASNHDELSAYHAVKYLSAWFRNDPRVGIDTDAKPRKYVLYGNTLLGFGHGDKEGPGGTKDKASRLASMVPIEAPELWGQSRFREFHAAHLHSEQMIQEINGVIVRRISAPTAADTYHTTSGYLGAVRKAQSFLYDKERGLMQIINTPVA